MGTWNKDFGPKEQRCERCHKYVRKAVGLEWDKRTLTHNPSRVPPRHSQGYFFFHASCAAKEARKHFKHETLEGSQTSLPKEAFAFPRDRKEVVTPKEAVSTVNGAFELGKMIRKYGMKKFDEMVALAKKVEKARK